MFNNNGMLLWQTLGSVPLPAVIEAKIAKEVLQWRSERRVQVQSCVNQTELTSELNLQGNYFIRVERHFRSKNDWLGENCERERIIFLAFANHKRRRVLV